MLLNDFCVSGMIRWTWRVLPFCLASSVGVAGEAAKTKYLQGPAREALLRHLGARSRQYDPEAQLVVIGRVQKGDYTKLDGKRAHPTRASIGYAAMLLEANDPEHRERACQIIRKILSLQDTNERSLTYGLWSWYAEEPLDKMFMPDFNWAAFIGKTLLYIIIHHDAQLPPALQKDVREAIQRACMCIRRRPLHMGYTNIAAMTSYVLLVAGERLEDPTLLACGRKQFDAWYEYTTSLGSFTEFNSPTYTSVAIGVVSRMMTDILDPDRRAKARQLNWMLWTHRARRFHAPTWQLAGPFSRSYTQLPGSGFGRLIRPGPDSGAELVSADALPLDVGDWRSPRRPPRDVARYLGALTQPREEVEIFFQAGHRLLNGMGNKSSRVSHIPILGTTYLHPRFSLGTVNFIDFWEQHRNLMAYWGTRREPAYLTLRCMNGRRGFCSAVFASVQRGGDVLAAVVFVTDRGNRYIDLDKLPRQTLKCTSLRIEFELGGHLDEARIPDRFDLDRPLVIEDRGTRIQLRYLGGTFAGEKPIAEIKTVGRRTLLVVHLYRGEERAFYLPSLTEAASLFAIRFTDADAASRPPREPKVSRRQGRYRLEWTPHDDELVLEAPATPLPMEDLQKQLVTTINGTAPSKRAKQLLPLPAQR